MPGNQQKPEEYEIEASNGRVYHVVGTAQQARDLGNWIEQRIADGDPDLKQDAAVPYNGQITHLQEPETGAIGSFLNHGIQGLTFNFGDEISAFGDALGLAAVDRLGDKLTGANLAGDVRAFWEDPKGFWSAYSHNLDAARSSLKAQTSQHPTASAIGSLAGAIAGAKGVGSAVSGGAHAAARAAPQAVVPAAAMLDAARLAAPVRTLAAESAVAGGVGGALAGAGEGETPEARAKNARLGGFGGAVLGGTLAPTLTNLAPAIARYGRVLLNRQPEQEATRQIIQALQRDGYDVTSPRGVAALKQELGNYLGKPVSLADIGHATRARAGVGLRAPSAAQTQAIDSVTGRQAGQAQRLANDIRGTVAPRTDVHALDDALIAERDAAALPLRDKALFTEGPGFGDPALPKQPLALPTGKVEPESAAAGLRRMLGLETPEAKPTYLSTTTPGGAGNDIVVTRQARIPEDPTLQQLARLPFAQRALGAAKGLAQEEVNLRSVLGQDISHLPDVNSPGASLDMRTFDYLKRFLDDEVSKLARGADTGTFKAAEYVQVRDLRNAIRTRMRETVPEYGDYLDAYRGSSEMRDALAEGRQFRALDPEQITAGQVGKINPATGQLEGGRSQAGQELYRVGAARDLLDTIGSTRDGLNPASRILNSDEARAQLAATGISPEDAARLNRSVDIERQFNKLPAELNGSATQQRLAAAADADAGAHVQLPFNPGSPIGWAGLAARVGLNRAAPARNAAVNEALLPRLLETDPAAIAKTIDELEKQGDIIQAAQLRRAAQARFGASVLGRSVGASAASTGTEDF